MLTFKKRFNVYQEFIPTNIVSNVFIYVNLIKWLQSKPSKYQGTLGQWKEGWKFTLRMLFLQQFYIVLLFSVYFQSNIL